MLAWVLAGACDAFAVLEPIGASAQDAFQDFPQNWVPYVSMGVRLAIVQTRWEKWETSERRATYGSNRAVARNMSIKSKHLYRIFGLTSLVFPLQQNLHGGLRGSSQVQLAEAQASGGRPDLRWSGPVGARPALLSRTLIH